MKSLNTVISCKVYPFDIMFSFGEGDDILLDQLSRYEIPIQDDPKTLISMKAKKGRCIMFSNGATLIRMTKVPENPRDKGVLAHELFHAVDFIMNRIGMTLTNSSDEAYAYLLEYLTVKIYKKLDTL